jgi:histidine ammonia-lyase
MRQLLSGSAIAAKKKEQVQDPYSFRCIPQVHGATRDSFDHVLSVFIKEINSVTDNPNIFPDEDLILSGGNFHGQPLAITLDFLSIAMSELASISERRTYQLISGQRSLPAFLVSNPGLNSGLMIPQYTAAGIVSENKQLCTPSSVDTIPSSNNQEDHVSMGANAATKCKRVVDNVEKVLAIELLTAVQALEFRRPLQTSAYLEEIVTAFRKEVSFNEADRILHEDMMKAVEFIKRDL